jgi:hypothetical protein
MLILKWLQNIRSLKGEVYEFAAVFLLLNKGLSPAFPVTGMDNLGSQANITGGKYPPAGVITDGLSTLLINNKGILELLLKAISTNHYRVEKEEDM